MPTPVASTTPSGDSNAPQAIAIGAAPDLLLLDEPTNHISLALADELEEALGHSAGTVVVATHDRWLRRRWTGDEVALSGVDGAVAAPGR